jgi:RNA recognition motif. (a.k.a. RRM, RBD, or RNP domain)
MRCSALTPSASLWTLTLAARIIVRDDNPAAEVIGNHRRRGHGWQEGGAARGACRMRLCVGPLALTTSEEALRQLCEPEGIVEWVPIITERETDRSRGFGCVESLNFSHVVAHKIWRWRGISPLRGRAHRLQRRKPLRCLLVPMDPTFDLLQTAMCDPLAERR